MVMVGFGEEGCHTDSVGKIAFYSALKPVHADSWTESSIGMTLSFNLLNVKTILAS